MAVEKKCSLKPFAPLALILNTVFLVVSLVLMVVGTFGGNWHNYKSPNANYTQISLWGRDCSKAYEMYVIAEGKPNECNRVRPDFFEFSGVHKHLDMVFVLLLVACSLCLTSLIVSTSMGCNFDNPDQWRRKGIAVTLLSFVGAVFADAAIIHERVKRDDVIGDYSFGWSLVITWASAFLLTAVFLLSLLLLACSPEDAPGKQSTQTLKGSYDTYLANPYAVERGPSLQSSLYLSYSSEAFTQPM